MSVFSPTVGVKLARQWGQLRVHTAMLIDDTVVGHRSTFTLLSGCPIYASSVNSVSGIHWKVKQNGTHVEAISVLVWQYRHINRWIHFLKIKYGRFSQNVRQFLFAAILNHNKVWFKLVSNPINRFSDFVEILWGRPSSKVIRQFQCPLKVDGRFGLTCRLHLQVRRIRRARNQRESWRQAELSTDYTALYPRRWNSLYPRLREPQIIH
jgi:hypothetical protein